MMIDHEHKIVYFIVPKAACSSLKHMIFNLIHDRPWKANIAYGSLLPATQIHKQFPSVLWNKVDHEAIKGYWKFAVVRDPIRRILSTYGNKIVYRRVLHTEPPRPTHKPQRHAVYAQINKDPDLNTFCLQIAQYRTASAGITNHTQWFEKFLGKDLSYFDKIYPIEDLNKLARDLSERTGKSVQIPHRNQTSVKVNLEDLSQAAFDRLMEYTRPDYELLDDFYTPPKFPALS